jgi:hypothetical protein
MVHPFKFGGAVNPGKVLIIGPNSSFRGMATCHQQSPFRFHFAIYSRRAIVRTHASKANEIIIRQAKCTAERNQAA